MLEQTLSVSGLSHSAGLDPRKDARRSNPELVLPKALLNKGLPS